MNEYNGKGGQSFGEVNIKVSVHGYKYDGSKVNKLSEFKDKEKRDRNHALPLKKRYFKNDDYFKFLNSSAEISPV